MSEEKKDHQEGCCTPKGSGCGCNGPKQLLFGIVIGALIFAAGMMFAKSNCYKGGMGKMCPIAIPK